MSRKCPTRLRSPSYPWGFPGPAMHRTPEALNRDTASCPVRNHAVDHDELSPATTHMRPEPSRLLASLGHSFAYTPRYARTPADSIYSRSERLSLSVLRLIKPHIPETLPGQARLRSKQLHRSGELLYTIVDIVHPVNEVPFPFLPQPRTSETEMTSAPALEPCLLDVLHIPSLEG